MRIDLSRMPQHRGLGMRGGTGGAVCDGKVELLGTDVCHIFRKGSARSIVIAGQGNPVTLTVVER